MGARFEGILAAMVTPFTGDDQSLDEETLASLTERLIDAGIGGLVPCGSTGEFTALTREERKRVVEVVIEAAAGRVPVIPHTGALTAAEAVDLSRHAERAGAEGIMAVTPYYDPPVWSDVKAYYRAIAAAVSVPIMLYHIPSATGQKFSADEIAELADIDNIASVKDSSGDGVLLAELLHRLGGRSDFDVFNGWDSLTFQGLAAGANACVWGAANVVPALCVELFDSLRTRGDLDAARAVWARIWPLCHFFESSGYAAAVKAGCDLVGHSAGPPRDPVQALPESDRRRLAALLEAAGASAVVPEAAS